MINEIMCVWCGRYRFHPCSSPERADDCPQNQAPTKAKEHGEFADLLGPRE